MAQHFVEVDALDEPSDVHAPPWRVHWSAVIIGALATLAGLVIVGLAGIALGSTVLGDASRDIEDWHKLGWGAVVLAVLGAFLASAAGGWIAGKVAGLRRAEPAMLHGAVAWLVAMPLLMACAAFGARSYLDPWHAGLAGAMPAAVATAAPPQAAAAGGGLATPTAIDAERAAKLASHGALTTLTAVLLGLMGGVIGGWIAAGEPMHFGHYRTAPPRTA